ncbi:hypothetical protein TNCT_113741 [Trichonephila clavata]|uniref:Uncharacterized protein n=1 Tax=Trichonephila clavata TaxID=2740835 RepID=A0A8X6LVY1_TRICU|nr:hypothetical protein TNCT_113741 [Trichonephila clavata]
MWKQWRVGEARPQGLGGEAEHKAQEETGLELRRKLVQGSGGLDSRLRRKLDSRLRREAGFKAQRRKLGSGSGEAGLKAQEKMSMVEERLRPTEKGK